LVSFTRVGEEGATGVDVLGASVVVGSGELAGAVVTVVVGGGGATMSNVTVTVDVPLVAPVPVIVTVPESSAVGAPEITP
jgi:hypothetical protein